MARIDQLLSYVRASGGSDLHLVAGLEPRVRVRGALTTVPKAKKLTDEALHTLLKEIVQANQWAVFQREQELDFAYTLPGTGRFRANAFQQENGAGVVFRIIPEQIRTFEQLELPPVLEKLAHLRSGLALVTGPTGSGKSTTLAAIIDKINRTYDRHIVTIEDPIEFVHKPRRSIITQREVGVHTRSFSSALRAALRQNPDVILVGEMRDSEVELALTAAEMGTLVFGTLHTNSAAKTIDRLIDAFPVDKQDQARVSLSEALSAVVAQLLLPTADGQGRCAAIEVLLKTSGLPNIIREGNTPQIASVIQGGRGMGMQTMDDALEALLRSGTIDPREAYLKATDKRRFKELGDGLGQVG